MNTQASIPNTIEDVEIGSLDGFLKDTLADIGVLQVFQILLQLLADHRFHSGPYLSIAKAAFGL